MNSPYPLVSRLILAALILSMLGCANRQRRDSGIEGEVGNVGPYAGEYEPYASPNGSGYSEDIPLTGRPAGGVDFYGEAVKRNLFAPIPFGFDEYTIPGSAQSTIQSVADFMRTNPDNLIMAGHTDASGTAEYNRNLGELRAIAVRTALVQSGVAADRIHTVSFGEDYPAQLGEDEAANIANRRAEFGFYR